nr:His/Gly/Thr/Pro-type tRNA ligase C-terminal domain-containing protein [Alphaproteobacteria bacterium]
AIPMQAATGPIGGDLSHEFIILADTGESAVFCDKALLEKNPLQDAVYYEGDLQPIVEEWTSLYAATDEKHDPKRCPVPVEQLVSARGIEVGHIFYFGTKYSEALKTAVAISNGDNSFVHMGSYGIGVSRLVAAIIEAYHDEAGIIWPESVAPYQIGLINAVAADKDCKQMADMLYDELRQHNIEVLYDDRDERAGTKFSNMDLIGLPWQVIVGLKGIKSKTVELKNRASGERQTISLDMLYNRFLKNKVNKNC